MEEQVPACKKVLRLNVDETAVRFYMPAPAGLVVPGKRRCGKAKPTQNATRPQQRACVARVAAVCDDAALQPFLPQLILGDEKTLPVWLLKIVGPALNKNVALLRRKSAWVNKDFLVTYVKFLVACLEPFASSTSRCCFGARCQCTARPKSCARQVAQACGSSSSPRR